LEVDEMLMDEDTHQLRVVLNKVEREYLQSEKESEKPTMKIFFRQRLAMGGLSCGAPATCGRGE